MKCKKLIFKSPMFGSVDCEILEKDPCVNDGHVEIGPEGMYSLLHRECEIAQFLDSCLEELGEYVPEDLKHLVVRATFGIYRFTYDGVYFVTEIYTRQEPNEYEVDKIKKWIEGQMSDGWGESIEQQEALVETVDYTEVAFDEYTCEFEQIPQYVEAFYHIHPWRAYDFYLELDSIEDAELDIPGLDPIVHDATCTIQENGEYKVRTVYQHNDPEVIIDFIRNSGVHMDEEFLHWLGKQCSFGCAIQCYCVLVNQGIDTRFLPMLGIMDNDLKQGRIYSYSELIDSVLLDEYAEGHHPEFYAEILTR